jgi:hypothetical protein
MRAPDGTDSQADSAGSVPVTCFMINGRVGGLAPHLHHADTEPMARIDADDDDLMRYVVRRYAYDPQRRERRHQIIVAFDNEREWVAFLDQAAAQLRQDRAAGLVTDPHDHYTGLVLEPGYRRGQQNGRLIRRAIERGADISAFLAGLDLSSNMAIIRAERSHDEPM